MKIRGRFCTRFKNFAHPNPTAATAQIMQAVQAMMGPMQGELVELRRHVARLELDRAVAGACVAVEKEPA